MAGKLDLLGPSCHEARFSFVDHSDVYLENVRLTEDLLNDLDTIQRRKHRQLIARRAEIQELRDSFNCISHFQDLNYIMASSRRQRKISRIEHNPELISAHYKTAWDTDADHERLETIEDGRSTPKPDVVRSISVKMPRTDKPAGVDDSESETGVVVNERQKSSVGERVKSAESSASQNRPRKTSVSKKSELEKLMDRMKLKQYPKEWYTTVLPASDVLIRRRVETAKPRSPDRLRKLARPSSAVGNPVKKDQSRVKSSVIGGSRSRSNGASPSPPVVNVTTVFCHDHSNSKTRRQLQEMSEYDCEPGFSDRAFLAHLALQRRREDSRQKREILDGKVKDFLRSLEELDKSRGRGTF